MPRSSDQHHDELETRRLAVEMARRTVVLMIADLMVAIKKPKTDAKIEDVLDDAGEFYDEYFGAP